MNALVTGGAGFVGRHVVNRLVKHGYHVTIVDNFYPGSGCQEQGKWLEHLQPDWSKVSIIRQDCRDYFKQYGHSDPKFDVVVHLAAIVGGRLVIENDPLAVGVDLSIDAEFFYWLSKIPYKPHRVHYFSSSAAYPIEFQKPDNYEMLTENMIQFDGGYFGQPDLSYGWSKLTGEFLARLTAEKHGHHITCYRPFSGYGEDQDLTYPFPSVLKRAMEGQTPMTVWGSGKQMRDFIYIEDCIDGMFIMSEKIGDGSAVNLSTGIPTNFNDFAKMAWVAVHGTEDGFSVTNTSNTPEGVFARFGSTDLQKKLGFTSTTSFEVGIKGCLDYMGHLVVKKLA